MTTTEASSAAAAGGDDSSAVCAVCLEPFTAGVELSDLSADHLYVRGEAGQESFAVIDLHNGSSFDYLLEMRGVRPGAAWKQTMMRHYLLALLGIIARVEEGELRPDVVVRGSSYFLSERSARRLGFTVSETSFLERLNLLLNVVDLLWTYSLANGQWTVPNLRNTRTVRTTGRNLVAQKSRIEAIVARISRGAPTRG